MLCWWSFYVVTKCIACQRVHQLVKNHAADIQPVLATAGQQPAILQCEHNLREQFTYTNIRHRGQQDTNLRVLQVPQDSVLPCIGSQIQVTVCPALSTACTRAGSLALSFSWPMRTMTASLPGVFSGLKEWIMVTRSLGSILSLTLTPMGLPMPRMNSTCAASSWRVRSPHHRK